MSRICIASANEYTVCSSALIALFDHLTSSSLLILSTDALRVVNCLNDVKRVFISRSKSFSWFDCDLAISCVSNLYAACYLLRLLEAESEGGRICSFPVGQFVREQPTRTATRFTTPRREAQQSQTDSADEETGQIARIIVEQPRHYNIITGVFIVFCVFIKHLSINSECDTSVTSI